MLESVPAEFKVKKTNCKPDGDVCYKDCKPRKGNRMVDHMNCTAKVSFQLITSNLVFTDLFTQVF